MGGNLSLFFAKLERDRCLWHFCSSDLSSPGAFLLLYRGVSCSCFLLWVSLGGRPLGGLT
jgi:hypothetical protein